MHKTDRRSAVYLFDRKQKSPTRSSDHFPLHAVQSPTTCTAAAAAFPWPRQHGKLRTVHAPVLHPNKHHICSALNIGPIELLAAEFNSLKNYKSAVWSAGVVQKRFIGCTMHSMKIFAQVQISVAGVPVRCIQGKHISLMLLVKESNAILHFAIIIN